MVFFSSLDDLQVFFGLGNALCMAHYVQKELKLSVSYVMHKQVSSYLFRYPDVASRTFPEPCLMIAGPHFACVVGSLSERSVSEWAEVDIRLKSVATLRSSSTETRLKAGRTLCSELTTYN